MASINFLDVAYNYKNVNEEVETKVTSRSLNDEMISIIEEVNEKYRDEISKVKSAELKTTVMEEKIINVLDKRGLIIEGYNRSTLIKSIMDELFGYSILQKYIDDPTINDIMVNDYDKIFIRKGMTDYKVPEKFKDREHYKTFLLKICAFIGEKLNISSPKVDGADKKYDLRIYISQEPINTYSPSLVIRKSHKNLDLSRIITPEQYPEEILKTIELMQKAGCRVIIAGPMESGKTTFMNAYLNGIKDERIVVMEDTPEVVLTNENVLYMQTVQDKNNESIQVSLADLVKSFKRSNGTMPVVSEVRSIESVELLDVYNSGFIKGCTSLHANSAKEVIRQLVFQIKASNKLGTDRRELEEYLSRTIDIIIYMEKRKIVTISEIYFDEETEKIEVRDLHRYFIEEETKNEIKGYYETCVNPFSQKMLDRIRRAGLLSTVPDKLRIK